MNTIDNEIAAFRKLYCKGNEWKPDASPLDVEAFIRTVAAASREEGYAEGRLEGRADTEGAARIMYAEGHKDGHAAAIEAVRERLPKESRFTNSPQDVGGNDTLAEIRALLDTITSPTKQ